MISIPTIIVDTAIKHFEKEIEEQTKCIQKKLKAFLHGKTRLRKKYIEYLVKISDQLITMPVNKMDFHRKKLARIISGTTMKTKPFIGFKDSILTCLGYEARRRDFYPRYYPYIGIKACIYCNSQLTITSEKTKFIKGIRKTEFKARFQVDHYWPKSEYPAFCVSLFNLYPACANCNLSKSADPVEFNLYETGTIVKSPYQFKLKPGSVSKFILSQNINDIELEFVSPKTKKGYQSTNETFDIDGIYATQKDIVAELIMKSKIYTPGYKKNLATEFSKLFKNDPALVDQLIVGNYTLEKDLHKRPLAKFMIDIAREVNLIADE